MKNAVITGATGPLGIALTELLTSKSINVLILTRKSSRVVNIPRFPSVKTVIADLSELKSIQFEESYDAFFHLGWASTANRTERENIYAQIENIGYSVDAVKLAHRLGCQVFVGAGSQSEFGTVGGIINENTPVNPKEPYGIAKLAAMQMCENLCGKLGIRFGWLRILSMYGKHDRETTFISYCINELMNHREPKLTPCEQIWDYIYSKDAAKAFFLFAENGTCAGIYALASGKPQTLKSCAEQIRDIINPKLSIGFGALPYPAGQVMQLEADISPLKRDLAFEPEYTFEQGVMEIHCSMKRRVDYVLR